MSHARRSSATPWAHSSRRRSHSNRVTQLVLVSTATNGGKQYGVLPPPDSGEQTDLGHNLPWKAPAGIAADTAAFLVLGAPTCTLYRTDYPTDVECSPSRTRPPSCMPAPDQTASGGLFTNALRVA
jgi:hypothetical protein